jgi:hypothetical protein
VREIGSHGAPRYAELKVSKQWVFGINPSWGVSPQGVPYARVHDIGHESYSVSKGVDMTTNNIEPGLNFRMLRTFLNSPTWHRAVMDGAAAGKLGKNVRFVSAPVFFELVRKASAEKQKAKP